MSDKAGKRSLSEEDAASAEDRPTKREKLGEEAAPVAAPGGSAAAAAPAKTGTKKKKIIKTVKKVVQKSAHTKQLEADIKEWQELATVLGAAEATPTKLRNFVTELQENLKKKNKRESELMNRLIEKETDIYNLESEQKELTEITNKKILQMRATFMDPLINENFRHMQGVVEQTKKELQKAEDDIKAIQFDPNNISGQQLMAKCRQLHKENEEAYKQLADSESARVQQQLFAQQTTLDGHAKDLEEFEELLLQMETELEAKQDQLFALEEEVKTKKREVEDLEHDNMVLREELGLKNSNSQAATAPEGDDADM